MVVQMLHELSRIVPVICAGVAIAAVVFLAMAHMLPGPTARMWVVGMSGGLRVGAVILLLGVANLLAFRVLPAAVQMRLASAPGPGVWAGSLALLQQWLLAWLWRLSRRWRAAGPGR